MQQKNNVLNFLSVDYISDFHPNCIRCHTLCVLDVGTLIPGTRLSYYLDHDPAMYYYNRNTAVVEVYMSAQEPSVGIAQTRMYAWSNYLLLKDQN